MKASVSLTPHTKSFTFTLLAPCPGKADLWLPGSIIHQTIFPPLSWTLRESLFLPLPLVHPVGAKVA